MVNPQECVRMSRIVRFHEIGGPEVLKLEEVEVGPPAADEVRIAVKAIGLNRAESMFRTDVYVETPKFPAKLGYEAAGVVEAVGKDVDAFKPGDAVSVIPPSSITRWGTYGELINVPAEYVVKHPEDLSWVEAAAIWMATVTAYGSLIDIAQLKKGEYVFINAASSSVGIAAIQVALAVGAIPIALTRTSAKKESLLRAGAAQVIVTQEEDTVARIKEITAGAGARVVFDPVAGPDIAKLTAAMGRFGILIIYGLLSPEATPLPLFDMMVKSLTVRGFIYKNFLADVEKREALKDFVRDAVASGRLRPIIANTFPLEKIVEATQYLESNQQLGKVVVTVSE
jgi:NADPH:quinone reductase-like Zn-dependent oxidoreductase